MRTIYKYQIYVGMEVELTLPVGAKFLRAAWQPYQGCFLWFELDPQSIMAEPRSFRVYDTGVPIEEPTAQWLATFDQNTSVRHVYEVKR